MISAPLPDNEPERLNALTRYEVLDTLPEACFDRITKLASNLLNVPISLVSLIDEDRQWFKSACGIDATETGRDIAFCAHAILKDEPFIIENALEDERFSDNPLVIGEPHIRFYAGIPLKTPDDFLIGTLCVIDSTPRSLSEQEIQLLQDFAAIVIDEMELHFQKRIVEDAAKSALQANVAKSKFLANMSHELRTPLNAILGFSQLLEMDSHLNEDGEEYVQQIHSAGKHLLEIIDEILDLSRIEAGQVQLNMTTVDLNDVFEVIPPLVAPLAKKYDVNLAIHKPTSPHLAIEADMLRLRQIILNLTSNAIKYSGEGAQVTLSYQHHYATNSVRISVSDTGKGIPSEKMEKLFQPFSRLGAEHTNIEGTGIGLVITKDLVELMNGQISVESTEGVGTTFWVDLPVNT
jgi:signal transduction histidine kinase